MYAEVCDHCEDHAIDDVGQSVAVEVVRRLDDGTFVDRAEREEVWCHHCVREVFGPGNSPAENRVSGTWCRGAAEGSLTETRRVGERCPDCGSVD